jgi:hypothetical protein
LSNKLNHGIYLPSWFLWLPRGFLLAAFILILQPTYLNFMHIPRQYDWFTAFSWGTEFFYLPLLIIAIIIAWRRPISGGTVSILTAPLLLLWFLLWVSRSDIFSKNNLLYFFSCIFLFIGGTLSVIYGQVMETRKQKISHISESHDGKRNWFRWLPRGFMLIAAFIPIFYALSVGFPAINDALGLYAVPVLFIVAIIAWVTPIIGGSVAIALIPFWMTGPLFFWAFTHQSGILVGVFFFFECAMLLLGGILSIIWGVMRWRWEHIHPSECR